MSEKEKENTAYHEAGHALCELQEHTDPLHKVTIIPRGPSLGSTMCCLRKTSARTARTSCSIASW